MSWWKSVVSRRRSSSQEATGQQQSSQCPVCLQRSIDPKLQTFGPDPQIADCLRELWALVQSTSADKKQTDELDTDQERYFINYINTFNGFYQGLGDLYTTSENVHLVRHQRTTTNNDTPNIEGHPVHVVRKLCEWFRQRLRQLSLSDSSLAPTDHDHPLQTFFALLQHLEILMRYRMNHHVFVEHGALSDLIDFMLSDLMDAYFPLLHTQPSNLPTNNSKKDVFENIIICALEIIQHVFDPDLIWKGWLLTWSSNSTASEVHSNARDRVSSIVSVILQIIDGMSDRKMSPKENSVVMQSLNTLGSLLFTTSRESITVVMRSDAITRLVHLVQWPSFLTHSLSKSKFSWKSTLEHVKSFRDPSILRTEFRLQILVLHILFTTLHFQSKFRHENSVRLEDDARRAISDAFRDLVAWITVCNGGFDSDEESYVGLNAFPLTPAFQTSIVASTHFQFEASHQQSRTSSMNSSLASFNDPVPSDLNPHQRSRRQSLPGYRKKKRLTSREAFQQSPIACQELDLVFRLWTSYFLLDLKRCAETKVKRELNYDSLSVDPLSSCWPWEEILALFCRLFNDHEPDVAVSDAVSTWNQTMFHRFVLPDENSDITIALPTIQFYFLEAASQVLHVVQADNFHDPIHLRMQQLLLRKLGQFNFWELVLGRAFREYGQQVHDGIQRHRRRLSFGETAVVSVTIDDRLLPSTYTAFLGEALRHRCWGLIETALSLDTDPETNYTLCQYLVSILTKSINEIEKQSEAMGVFRSMTTALKLNGKLTSQSLMELHVLSLAVSFLLRPIPDGVLLEQDFEQRSERIRTIFDLLDQFLLGNKEVTLSAMKNFEFLHFLFKNMFHGVQEAEEWTTAQVFNLLSVTPYLSVPQWEERTQSTYALESTDTKYNKNDVFDLFFQCFTGDNLRFRSDRIIILFHKLNELIRQFGGNVTIHARFGDVKLYDALFDLLQTSATISPETCRTITIHVFETLTLILAGMSMNKEYFDAIGGYRKLAEHLLRQPSIQSDMVYVDLILGMMLDRSPLPSEFSCDLIRNPLAFDILARVYPAMGPNTRLSALQRLLALLNTSYNLVIFSSVHPIRKTLNFIIPSVKSHEEMLLLESLLVKTVRQNVNVKDLKALLGCLNIKDVLEMALEVPLPVYYMPVLQCLTVVALHAPIPNYFWSFSGLRSGLSLPPAENLFSTAGFSIGMWFRMEYFDPKIVRRRVFQVFDAPGSFEVYSPRLFSFFSEDFVNGFEAYFNEGSLEVEIKSGKDYTIVPVEYRFEPGHWYFFCVNYAPPKKLSLSKGSLVIAVDGVERTSLKLDPPANQTYAHNCFFGRFVSADPEGDHGTDSFGACGDLASAWLLRRSLTANEILNLFKIGFDDINIFGSHESTDNEIVYFFHPRGCLASGETCLNLAPAAMRSKITMTASVRFGIRCHRRSIKKTIQNVGGMKLWLHLVDKLPLLYRKHARSPNAEGHPCEGIFNSIISLLRDSPENISDFKENNILMLVNFLLRRPDNTFIPETIFKSLWLFLDIAATDEELVNDLYKFLLCDMRIWSKTSVSVRLRHAKLLQELMESDHLSFRSHYDIVFFVDTLDEFYNRRQEDRNDNDVKELRFTLFSIVETFIQFNATNALQKIIATAIYSQDHFGVTELLEFLVNLVQKSQSLAEDILSCLGSAYDGIVALLYSTNDDVQCSALKLFTQLVYFSKTLKLKSQTEPLTITTVLTAWEHGTLFMTKHYEVLLAGALESELQVAQEIIQVRPSFSRNTVIRNTPFVLAIIRLLPKASTDDLVHRILTDVLTLLNVEYESNCSALRRVSEWMSYMLDFIASVESEREMGKPVKGLAIEVVATVLSYLARTDARGWAMVEEACLGVWIRHEGRWKGMLLARELLGMTLQMLEKFSTKKKVSDVEKLLRMVEDLLFNYHDVSSTVKKHIVQKTSHEKQGGEIMSLVIRLAESREIMHSTVKQDGNETHRDGGVFRIVLRTILWGLMSVDLNASSKAANHLQTILSKYTVGHNQQNEENTPQFMKLEPTKKILYVMGYIHQAYMSARSSGKQDMSKDLLNLYMSALKRWRLHLSAYQVDLGGIRFNDTHDVEDYVQSSSWAFLHDTHFVPAMKSIEEEMSIVGEQSSKRYLNTVKVIDLKTSRAQKSERDSKTALLERANEYKKTIVEKQTARRSEQAQQQEKEDELLTLKWVQISRELRGPTGLWAAIHSDELHWKLDSRENESRMRRKLAHNYFFNDHTDASLKRDKSDLVTAMESPSIRLPMTRKKMLDSLTESPGGKTLNKRISDLSLLSEASAPAVSEEPEDWDLLDNDDIKYGHETEQEERLVYSTDCELILLMSVIRGRFEISNKHLSFVVDHKSALSHLNDFDRSALIYDGDTFRNRKWSLADLREIQGRRHLLQLNALEFFFVDRSTFLFSFAKTERKKVYQKIVHLKPPNLGTHVLNTADFIKKSVITEKWVNREISNFDYLMMLNTLAGRSFNDLTQYPVFPWILQDYTSSDLNLGDPKIYRDLSKPIGALSESRLQRFLERYHSFVDPNGTPKFHYGTHYSSAATVLFYLLRQEPFTSLHIALQNGKFDHADRQFHDMASTWQSCLENTGDVKELIPEFFFHPEILVNANHFDLGLKQTGIRLNDVILPPWAKGSPHEFIRIHRQALESDYVSDHLHHWIDLIFGNKQRGEEAIKAHNVFYYLTYEGAVDLDTITDPIECKSIESQINNFGQTPFQLFQQPHPKRTRSNPSALTHNLIKTPAEHQSFVIPLKKGGFKTMVCLSEDASQEILLGMVSEKGHEVIRWTLTASSSTSLPFTVQSQTKSTKDIKMRQRYLSSSRTTNERSVRHVFGMTRDGKILFSGGHWDGSVRLVQTETSRIMYSLRGHFGLVSCLEWCTDEETLITGSVDATIYVWTVKFDNKFNDGVLVTKKFHLTGHEDTITSISSDVDHDMIVTTSMDGSAILYSLSRGTTLQRVNFTDKILNESIRYYNSLRLDDIRCLAHASKISCHGDVLVNTETRNIDLRKPILHHIHRLSVNGQHLKVNTIPNRVNHIGFDQSGEYVLVGDDAGLIWVLAAHK